MRPSPPRVRPLAALLAVLCSAAAVLSGAAIGADALDRNAPMSGADRELRQAAAEAREALADQLAALETPEARAERRRSRAAHGSQTAAEALATTRRRLRPVVETPAFGPLRGRRVRDFFGANAARVAGEDGDRVVVSTTPLRRAGGEEPVDLSLRERGRGFRPAAPHVDVAIPRTLHAGVALAGTGVSFAPAGVVTAEDGVLAGDNVFYANARPDTDVLVRPLPGGFETFEVLRSAKSPELLPWRLSLPDGVTARPGPADGAAVEILRDGRVAASIGRPYATDADGRRVAVAAELEGDTLRLAVDHRDEDVAYPVVVDPPVDAYTWECRSGIPCTADQSFAGWTFWAVDPAYRFSGQSYTTGGYLGAGLYVRNLHQDFPYSNGEKGEWQYIAPAASYIVRAQYHNLSQDNVAGSNTCLYTGIWARGKQPGYWESGPTMRCAQNFYNESSLHTTAGSRSNTAVFGTQISGDGRRSYFMDHAGWIEIELSDEDRPTMQATLGDEPYDGRWTKDPITLETADQGLGVKSGSYSAGGAPSTFFVVGCAGTRRGGLCPNRFPLTVTPPEGISDLTGTVTDALGQRGHLGRGLYATYFDNVNFTGWQVHHVDEQVNVSTGTGVRPTPSVAGDSYSVRWEGRIKAPTTGTYTFHTPVDDRVRLWVKSLATPIINAGCCNDASASIALTAGELVPVKMELEQDGGPGGAALSWTPPGGTKQLVPAANLYPGATGPHGVVYDNDDFGETEGGRYTRPSSRIDFDWGAGTPDSRINPDTFSYRWTAELEPRYTEDYTLSTTADDFAKVYVNGQLVVNDQTLGLNDQAGTPIRLDAGKRYHLKVDFVEKTGNARASVYWQSARQAKELIPQAQMQPVNAGPVTVRADRSAPTDAALGDAFRALDGKYVAGSKVVPVTAKDGTAAVAASGVASAELWVDGAPASDTMSGSQRVEQACAAGSCPISANLELDPFVLAEGRRRVKAVVTDHVGNSTPTDEVSVYVDRTNPLSTHAHVANSSGWRRPGQPAAQTKVDGTDEGAGVQFLELDLPEEAPAGTFARRTVRHAVDCAGGCPASAEHTFTYGPALADDLPEGRNKVIARAIDASGRVSSDHAWDYRVDRTGPVTVTSGALWDARDTTIATGELALSVRATDGSPAATDTDAERRKERSGARKIDIFTVFKDPSKPSSEWVRVRRDGIDTPCAQGNCERTLTWTLRTSDFAEGPHDVVVVSEDEAGNTTEQAFPVAIDRRAPAVTLSGAATQAVNPGPALHVAADDRFDGVGGSGVKSVEVKVDGVRDGTLQTRDCGTAGCAQTWAVDHTIDWSTRAEGSHVIEVVVLDGVGNRAVARREVVVDRSAPELALSGPLADADTEWLGPRTYDLAVTASDSRSGVASVEVLVDGIQLAPLAEQPCPEGACGLQRTWTVDAASLASGSHLVQVLVLDHAGRLTQRTLSFPGVDEVAPQISLSGTLADAAGTTISDDRRLAIATTDGSGAGTSTVEVLLDGERKALFDDCSGDACDKAWTLATATLSDGDHTVRVVATDAAGNIAEREVAFRFLRNGPPTAPALDATRITSVQKQTAFLYEGSDPVQTGVAAGTIEPRRAAAIRGMVTERDGTPIAGVEATVVGHAEFGRTATRSDGELYMAVNGGGPLTVRLEKDGYLPVDRLVDVPWQGYAHIDDTVLIAPDSAASTFDIALNPTTFVHRGTKQVDSNGERQVTLLFPAGMTATAEDLETQTRTPLPRITVRATEYTVGPTGANAMPAALPQTSAYTYAADFSIDEAKAIGAEHVHFSKPVVGYLENFRHAPVGARVPNGYYERSTQQWVPDSDGRVIEVLAEVDGLARVDLTGGGTAATAEDLATVGIDAAELRKLAELYEPGQELWRVPTSHFSDWNFAYRILGVLDDVTDWWENQIQALFCGESGSVIECDNQTLGEDVELTGTGMGLHYRSDRVPARTDDRYAVEIPLIGAEVPDGLVGADVRVEIAGRKFGGGRLVWTPGNRNLSDRMEELPEFPAEPNTTHRFEWDGRDAFGRKILGAQNAKISVGHTYWIRYNSDPPQLDDETRQFATPPGDARLEFSGCDDVDGCRRKTRVTVWRDFEVRLGGWDARAAGLGGWTLTEHHQYDPTARILYRGDGSRQSGEMVNRVIDRYAGTNQGVTGPATGQAETTPINTPQGLDVGPDGSVYVAEFHAAVVRRIHPDGRSEVVAGVPKPTSADASPISGDGGPATAATLARPTDVEVGPDGSLYITDSGHHRVRRVWPDGTIGTVAGGAVNLPHPAYGDGRRATEAELRRPMAVAVTADGTLFIADHDHGQVRRVGTDGVIRRYAGGGAKQPEAIPDLGGPQPSQPYFATEAQLSGVTDLALDGNGRLYLAAVDELRNRGRVYRVSADGTIVNVAGVASADRAESFSEVEAVKAHLYPRHLGVSRSGTVTFTDERSDRLWRLDPDGKIRTVIAGGATGDPRHNGDGGAAGVAKLYKIEGVAFGPDGAMYLADYHSVRRVADAMMGFDGDDLAVPSGDGSELYRFDATGRHLSTHSTATGRATMSFAYDAQRRLIGARDADGNDITVERDAAGKPTAIVGEFGHRTALDVDAAGWLTEARDPAQRATRMGYEREGLLTRFERPGGDVTTLTYGPGGRLLSDANADGGSKTLSRTSTRTRRTITLATKEGRTTTHLLEETEKGTVRRTTTDAAGDKTVVTNDDDGRTTVEGPDGTRIEQERHPDPRFGMQSGFVGLQRVTRPVSHQTSESLATRKVTLADPDDLLSAQRVEESTELTKAGGGTRKSTTVWARNPANGGTVTATTPAGRTATETYDSRGRLVQSSPPDVASVSYAYDAHGRPTVTTQGDRTATSTYDPASGWLRTTTDALGRTTTYDRDVLGRVTATHLPGGRTVRFEYDAAGNVERVVPAGRPAHSFAHSLKGMRMGWTPPAVAGTGSTRYEYDDDQELEAVVRPDGTRVDFARDGAGRVTTVNHSGQTATLSYHETNGALISMSTTAGYGLAWEYDGRLRTTETATGPVPGRVEQTFDRNGRIVTSTVVGTDPVQYAFDDDDLLTAAGPLTLVRDAQSGVVNGTQLAQATTTTSYDAYGDVAASTYRHGTTAAFTESVERDVGGRVEEETETLAGATRQHEYVYDAAGRLAQVKRDGAVVAAYGYDLNGNRTSETVGATTTTSSYDDQDRLLARGGVEYRYTANGDLREKVDGSATTTYAYDAIGNLKTVDLPDGRQVRYLVDPLGRRVGREVDGQRTHGWVYGDAHRPSAELAPDGSVRSRFVYAESTTVPSYMVRGGKTYRFVTDRLGSPRLVVDADTGAVAQELDYDPWGRVVQDTNPGFQPFGFAGGLYESATGLVRFGARDYDPEAGRWTAKDPIGFAGGDTNLYGYSANDPINFVDPSGLSIDTAIDAGSTAAAAAGALMGCRPWSDVAIAAGAMLIPGVTAAMLKGAINAARRIDWGKVGRRLSDETGTVQFGARRGMPAVDRTGKVHGQLPDHVPSKWTRDELEELAGDLQGSIRTRHLEQLRLGEHGPHRARIEQERRLLRQIQRTLGDT